MFITKKQLKELNEGKVIEVDYFYLEGGFPRSKKIRISVKKVPWNREE